MNQHPHDLFRAAQRVSAGTLREWLGRDWWRWRDVLAFAPVRAVGDGFFEVLPAAAARARDVRPVVAVRAGVPAAWIVADAQAVEGRRLAYPAELTGPVHDTPRDAALCRHLCTLAGEEVVDLLALDFGLVKSPRLLCGMAEALGDADGEVADAADEDSPLPLAGAVRDVLFGRVGLVLPLGNAVARAAYLRRAGAVVAPSLDAARAVKKLLEVPMREPKLFVREAPRDAAGKAA